MCPAGEPVATPQVPLADRNGPRAAKAGTVACRGSMTFALLSLWFVPPVDDDADETVQPTA
jgi:hypothetical protein